MVLRRSYKRTSKQLLRDNYNGSHPRRRKKAKASRGKLKTIAGRLVWELERKLTPGEFATELELFKKVLAQVDILVMLTPRTGHTDPPKDFGQKDKIMAILQFFSKTFPL